MNLSAKCLMTEVPATKFKPKRFDPIDHHKQLACTENMITLLVELNGKVRMPLKLFCHLKSSKLLSKTNNNNNNDNNIILVT